MNSYIIPKSCKEKLQNSFTAEYILAFFVVSSISSIYTIAYTNEPLELGTYAVFLALYIVFLATVFCFQYYIHTKIWKLYSSGSLKIVSGSLIWFDGYSEHNLDLSKTKYILKLVNSEGIILYGIFPGIFGKGLLISKVWDLDALDNIIEEFYQADKPCTLSLQNLYLRVNYNLIIHIMLWSFILFFVVVQFLYALNPIFIIILDISIALLFSFPYPVKYHKTVVKKI